MLVSEFRRRRALGENVRFDLLGENITSFVDESNRQRQQQHSIIWSEPNKSIQNLGSISPLRVNLPPIELISVLHQLNSEATPFTPSNNTVSQNNS